MSENELYIIVCAIFGPPCRPIIMVVPSHFVQDGICVDIAPFCPSQFIKVILFRRYYKVSHKKVGRESVGSGGRVSLVDNGGVLSTKSD